MDDMLDRILSLDGASPLFDSKFRIVEGEFRRRGEESPFHAVKE